MKKVKQNTSHSGSIRKAMTGIKGLDEITLGGFPAGRPTLICGGPGAGKTMLAAEFLISGAMQFNEPGVFIMFEENAEELTANVGSMGFDLHDLVAKGMLSLDHVHIERSEIEETGEYDLEGLFIRISHAIESIGAKRVALDTLEALFAGLPNHAILRAELRRLFRWLKDKGMTAVITAERGDRALTRYGLEEYVADCVILLDNRVQGQISTRRLRIIKYRGSSHGTNEYPFLIGSSGISVMPVTSLGLDHDASEERMSTGIERLDDMLGGKGIYRGSSVLVTGTPGTGKSSIGAIFAAAACKRGEKALLFSYEESSKQLVRNMRSIGLDVRPYEKKGLLRLHTTRPTLQGLEQHLVAMHDEITSFNPSVVVIDPISNLSIEKEDEELKPTLIRLIDLLKSKGITTLFTSLITTKGEMSEVGVSSLMDTWLQLKNVESNGERNRTLFVLKSRGMNHSNQIREFVMTDKGIDLVDVYLGSDRVLTGTARVAQAEHEKAEAELMQKNHERRLRDLANKRRAIDAQIAALQAEAAAEEEEIDLLNAQETLEAEAVARRANRMSSMRGGKKSASRNS